MFMKMPQDSAMEYYIFKKFFEKFSLNNFKKV